MTARSWRLPSGAGSLQVRAQRKPGLPRWSPLTTQLEEWIRDPLCRPALLEMFDAAGGAGGARTVARSTLRLELESAFAWGALVTTAKTQAGSKSAHATAQSWTLRPTRHREVQIKRREFLSSDERMQEPEKLLAQLDDLMATPATRVAMAQMFADLKNMPKGQAPSPLNPVALRLMWTELTKAIQDKVIVAVVKQGGSAVDAEKSAPPPSEPPKPKQDPKEKTWFQIQVLDEEGVPMAGESYTLVDSDGGNHKGKLDGDGKMYIPPILSPGDCTLTLPDVHLNPRKRK
jgi:hypothetical protein